MKNLESRYGQVWIDQGPTPIESLEVSETSGGTVQLCARVLVPNYAGSRHQEELLLELDVGSAWKLSKRILESVDAIERHRIANKLRERDGAGL